MPQPEAKLNESSRLIEHDDLSRRIDEDSSNDRAGYDTVLTNDGARSTSPTISTMTMSPVTPEKPVSAQALVEKGRRSGKARAQWLQMQQRRESSRSSLSNFDSRRAYHPWRNAGHVVTQRRSLESSQPRESYAHEIYLCITDGRDLGLKLAMLLSWALILVLGFKIYWEGRHHDHGHVIHA